MDLSILESIQNNFQSPLNDIIFSTITKLGDAGFLWLVIAFALIVTKKYRKIGILVVMALILTTLVGELFIKHLVQRPRPFVVHSHLNTVIPKVSGYSFPSGHTASSFAAAIILINEFKKYWIPILVLAIGIAISRLYLLVHYPSDVIAGMLLGISCSLVVLKMAVFKNCKKQ